MSEPDAEPTDTQRIAQLIETINEQETRIATAWRERDALSKQLTVCDDLLRAAIRLLAHFAGTR